LLVEIESTGHNAVVSVELAHVEANVGSIAGTFCFTGQSVGLDQLCSRKRCRLVVEFFKAGLASRCVNFNEVTILVLSILERDKDS